jgi:hypothetical protein
VADVGRRGRRRIPAAGQRPHHVTLGHDPVHDVVFAEGQRADVCRDERASDVPQVGVRRDPGNLIGCEDRDRPVDTERGGGTTP